MDPKSRWDRVNHRHSVLLVAGLCGAAFLALPFGIEAQAVVLLSAGGVALVGPLVGVRRWRPADPRPWWALSISTAAFIVGTVLREIGVPGADLGDMIGFGAGIYVATRLVRTRLTRTDRTAVVDSLIAASGVAVLYWIFAVAPVMGSNASFPAKASALLFSVLSLVALVQIGRIAIGPGVRNLSFHLLAAAAFAGLAADAAIAVETTRGAEVDWATALLLLATTIGFACIGSGGLHPGMATVSTPASDHQRAMTRKRQVAMTAASLVAPITLVLLARSESLGYEIPIIAGCWIITTALIMYRLAGLVRFRERRAAFDQVLATASATLVSAADRFQMNTGVLDGVSQIAALTGQEHAARVYSVDSHREFTVDAQAGTPQGIDDREFAIWLDALDRAELVGSPSRPFATAAGERIVLVSPMVVQNDIRGLIAVATEHPLPSSAREAIESLTTTASLALATAELRTQMHNQRSERRFRGLVENSQDLIFVTDERGTVEFTSPTVARTLGVDEAALLGSSILDLTEGTDREMLRHAITSPSRSSCSQVHLRTLDGIERWFEVSISDLTADEEINGLVVTAHEITGRRLAEHRLARSESRFRSLVQQATDMIVVVDVDGIINYVSPSVVRLLGRPAAQLLDRELESIVVADDRSELATLLLTDAERPAAATAELRVTDSEGHTRVLEVTVSDMRDEPSIEGLVVNAHDITQRKELEQTLRSRALHDSLTGLANRTLFSDRVRQALTRRDQAPVTIMVVGLHDLRTINEGMGHRSGDELIQVCALRLEQFVRSGDTVARLGGDEFALLLEEVESGDQARHAAARVLEVIHQTVDLDGTDVIPEASIGIATSPDLDEPDPDNLLRAAEIALITSKARSRSSFLLYDASMQSGAFERLELKADLEQALNRDQLVLHYQPIVELASGRVMGFEALMRWEHPVRGMVGPGTFISLAEESGAIIEMGRWLAEQAIAQLALWQAHTAERLSMSINVSPRQLEDRDLVDILAESLARHGIAPEQLIIELTETMIVGRSNPLVAQLDAMRSLGLRLHADDFGSGFASYAALQELPFTGVKIDMSLTAKLGTATSHRADAQVRSIITMAAEAGMDVIAEGIEGNAQLGALNALGCPLGQGYYFAKPMAADQIELQQLPIATQ